MTPTSAFCTGLSCYGKEIPGAPLRCPNCGGTELQYRYAKKAVPA